MNKLHEERIIYLDIMKALGIFSIYFLHFGRVGGFGYLFGFYSVSLFFFVSGCAESISKELDTRLYIKKKLRTIVLPYFIFAIASVGINLIKENSFEGSKSYFLQILNGCIRNVFFAPGLWFLTCLFVVCISFFIIRKIKSKIIVIGICLFLYLLAEHGMPHRPTANPSWIWNVDSAAEYLVYYCSGYFLFPYIDNIIKKNKLGIVVIKGCISIVVVSYGVTVFLGKNALYFMSNNEIGALFYPLISNMLIIILYIIGACILQDSRILQEIGQNTLFLCGSELMIKSIIGDGLLSLGIRMEFVTPLSLYVYTLILLIIGIKFFVPLEKLIFKRLHIL